MLLQLLLQEFHLFFCFLICRKRCFHTRPSVCKCSEPLKYTHTHTHWCYLTGSPSKLACQERHWTFLNEYQRHRWWRRRWSSSSCSGTETRAHKECKCSFCCLWKMFYLCYLHTYVCAGVHSLGDRSHPCPESLRGRRRGFQGRRQAEKEGQDVWWGNHG